MIFLEYILLHVLSTNLVYNIFFIIDYDYIFYSFVIFH